VADGPGWTVPAAGLSQPSNPTRGRAGRRLARRAGGGRAYGGSDGGPADVKLPVRLRPRSPVPDPGHPVRVVRRDSASWGHTHRSVGLVAAD